jgi:hypothetical protein
MNIFCQAAGFKSKHPTEHGLGKNLQIYPFRASLAPETFGTIRDVHRLV